VHRLAHLGAGDVQVVDAIGRHLGQQHRSRSGAQQPATQLGQVALDR
jgi:hypothetical protein